MTSRSILPPKGRMLPKISLLEARSQDSGRLPCKTIYKGIRTCTTRQAPCFQPEIRFRDKGQASVESARLLLSYGASLLETGGYITYLAGIWDTWA